MRSEHQLYKYVMKIVLHHPSGDKVWSYNWQLSVQPAWGDQKEKLVQFLQSIRIIVTDDSQARISSWIFACAPGSYSQGGPYRMTSFLSCHSSAQCPPVASLLPQNKTQNPCMAPKAFRALHTLLFLLILFSCPFSAPAILSLQGLTHIKPAPPQRLCTYCLLCLECHPSQTKQINKNKPTSGSLPQLFQVPAHI